MFMRGRPITMFIPSDVESYDEVRIELPPERLKLEWVYPSVRRLQRHKRLVLLFFLFFKGLSVQAYPRCSLTVRSYGYRGRDCRANVYLLPTGEIVYFIASVVILFNYEERTQRHYLGHTDCVKW